MALVHPVCVALLWMSHGPMAADAGDRLAATVGHGDRFDNRLMASTAGVFRDCLTARFHPNRLMEITRGEGVGVPKAVIGLRIILRH